MVNVIDTGDCIAQRVLIKQIAINEFNRLVIQPFGITGFSDETSDGVFFFQEEVNKVAPDKAGAACNEYVHVVLENCEECVGLTLKCRSSILNSNLRVNPALKAAVEASDGRNDQRFDIAHQ